MKPHFSPASGGFASQFRGELRAFHLLSTHCEQRAGGWLVHSFLFPEQSHDLNMF